MAPKIISKPYTDDDLIAAVAEIRNKKPYRATCSKYNIPYTTLHDKVTGRVPIKKSKPGPSSYLTDHQEERLGKYLLTMTKIGYGLELKDIPSIVKEILDKAEADGFIIPDDKKFKDNRPGDTWIYGFLKRNPEATPRTPEYFGYQRAAVTEPIIRQWFKGLENFLLKEHNIVAKDFLTCENGSRIFNLDESGFPLQGTNSRLKVIAEKGTRNVYKLSTDNKTNITVLGCVSASGCYSKPMVIYPGMKLPRFNLEGVNEEDYDLGYTPNGWISSDSFFSWISNLFYPSIQNKVAFPIIVFMDGHSTHINLAVAEFCKDHGIILYCFPAHSSHVLQPLDISIFGPVKREWNRQIDHFKRKFKVCMTKSHFFQVFDPAWKASAKPENAKSGFRASGLVPLNADAVDYSKTINTNALTEWRKQSTIKKIDEAEMVGIARCLNIVDEVISAEEKDLFSRRYEENYDVPDNSSFGKLWKIYRDIRKAKEANLEVCGRDENDNTDQEDNREVDENNAESQNVDEEQPLGTLAVIDIGNSEIVPVFEASISNEIVECTSDIAVTDFETTPITSIADSSKASHPILDLDQTNLADIPEVTPADTLNRSIQSGSSFDPVASSSFLDRPSTSHSIAGSNQIDRSYYENVVDGPFAHYLKISDELLITRKTDVKSKIPPAISGVDYIHNLRQTQEKKKKEIEEKEKRKLEREKKKIEKQREKGKKIKRNANTQRLRNDDRIEDGYDLEIVYDDSSDSDIDEDKNVCFACDGNEDWHVNDLWIGCDCNRWFHKTCISDGLDEMSTEEIEAYDFKCSFCSKRSQRTKKQKLGV